MSEKQKRVAVVLFPWKAEVPYKFINDIIQISIPICSKIYIIGGTSQKFSKSSSKINIFNVRHQMHYVSDIEPLPYSIAIWLAKCIYVQILSSIHLLMCRKDIDAVCFYMAYPYFFLPLLTSKIIQKPCFEVITRSSPIKKHRLVNIYDRLLFSYLNGVSFESKSLENNFHIKKDLKILPTGLRYIDTNKYKPIISYSERENVIGFVGRLRYEKGIMEFFKAIPLIWRKNKSTRFIIIGNGDLYETIIEEHKKFDDGLKEKVTIEGYVSEGRLPQLINQMKLLVLPTVHSEGLPTTILESMACGTPVVTTNMGAIGDVIVDKKNGFMMENNNPATIAKEILNALSFDHLDAISHTATETIREDFSFDGAMERYRNIYDQVCDID